MSVKKVFFEVLKEVFEALKLKRKFLRQKRKFLNKVPSDLINLFEIKQELLCSMKHRMRMFKKHPEIISYSFKLMNQSIELINRVYLERLPFRESTAISY